MFISCRKVCNEGDGCTECRRRDGGDMGEGGKREVVERSVGEGGV